MADPYGKDLRLTGRAFDRMTSDREPVDLRAAVDSDLRTVSGRENLAQALVNRLLTRRGELTRLGHPNYGSRLHMLVGELNNTRTRGLAELYIRECLKSEPRIAAVTQVAFAPPVRGQERDTLYVSITVQPIDGGELTLVIPLRGG
ncbi:MAG: GPW/gp25 family protein [Chloroflexi bacterium]|nr:GPW/gp25 family protein [Chloroflexota bacterium]